MKYLLANVLVYDNEDGSLTLQNDPDPESQVLTCTAQTILNLLLAHHGLVVERETRSEERRAGQEGKSRRSPNH